MAITFAALVFIKCIQLQDIVSALPDSVSISVGWGCNDRLLPIEGASLLRKCELLAVARTSITTEFRFDCEWPSRTRFAP
jgi:hypothetical protein